MIIIRIIQLQFLFLVVFLVSVSVAGEKAAQFWFTLTALIIGALFLFGKIAQSRR
jgi:hypothetical protein